MKLGDLLNNLASKNGSQNDKALIDLLSKAELANVEVDDTFANNLDTALMSLEGAKNNAAVLNHYKPIILKAADDKFSVLAEKYGISDDIANEKSTYKKFDLLDAKIDAKIAELKEKSGKTTNAQDVEKYNNQIADLQSKLARATEENARAISELIAKHNSAELDMLVNFDLNGRNYANKNIAKEVNVITAKTLLNKALAEAKAIVVNENGALKLKQAENPTMDYVDSGYKPVSFADFTNKMLAESKMLEVSAGGNATQQNAQPDVARIVTTTTGNRSKFDEAFAQANEQFNK